MPLQLPKISLYGVYYINYIHNFTVYDYVGKIKAVDKTKFMRQGYRQKDRDRECIVMYSVNRYQILNVCCRIACFVLSKFCMFCIDSGPYVHQ